jgi:hypothetical protein
MVLSSYKYRLLEETSMSHTFFSLDNRLLIVTYVVGSTNTVE